MPKKLGRRPGYKGGATQRATKGSAAETESEESLRERNEMGPVQTATEYERHPLTVTSQERGQVTQDHVEQVRDGVYEQQHYKEQASCFLPLT